MKGFSRLRQLGILVLSAVMITGSIPVSATETVDSQVSYAEESTPTEKAQPEGESTAEDNNDPLKESTAEDNNDQSQDDNPETQGSEKNIDSAADAGESDTITDTDPVADAEGTEELEIEMETETETVQEVIERFAEFDLNANAIHLSPYAKPSLEDLISIMPDTLRVYLADSTEPVDIDVTWFCIEQDYETSSSHYFQFSPKWDEEKYILQDGFNLYTDGPYIGVFLDDNGSGYSGKSVTGNSNETTIYNYLTGTMGLNSAAACGVMANIYCESSFNPNATGDSGTSYGICQWHSGRWTAMKNWCSSNGYDSTTLDGQLHYLQKELSANDSTYLYNGKTIYNYLTSVDNTADGAYSAASYWCIYYEVPANKESVAVTRGNLAKNTYWPEYCSISYSDIGTGFYAYIIFKSPWRELGLSDTNVRTENMEGTSDHLWYFEQQSDGGYKITNVSTQTILDVAGGSGSGSNVQVYESNDTSAQRWYITGTAGCCQLHPGCALDCSLDITDGSTAENANVQIYTTNGSDAQNFQIYNADENLTSPVITTTANGGNLTVNWTTKAYADYYNVRVFQDTNYTGTDYTQWNCTGSTLTMELPDGHYYVYVDAVNSMICKQSNIIEVDLECPEEIRSITWNGSTYTLYNALCDWYWAEDYCENKGGHLAVITSAEEMEQVAALISDSTKEYFIGATDADEEGTWKWVTGEPFEYTNWADGEPNDDGDGEDFLTAWNYKSAGVIWNDEDKRESFICEISGPSVKITLQPQDTTVEAGEIFGFDLQADGNGLTYLWQYSKDNGVTWIDTTRTKNTYTTTATTAMNGRLFRCIVTDAAGASVTSDAAKLTVTSPIKITAQPVSTTVVAGNTFVIQVTAKSITGSTLSYLWQYSKDNGATWTDTTRAKNNFTTTATTAMNGRLFRCVIRDADGNSLTSDTAVLTVKPAITITVQPIASTVKLGEKFTFKVTAVSNTGSKLSYLWQYSKTLKGWTDTTRTINNYGTYATLGVDGKYFRCKITDEAGNVLYSEPAMVRVLSEITITGQPEDTTVGNGKRFYFTVSATGASLTYLWQYSVNGGKTWIDTSRTKSNYTTYAKTAMSGRMYRCVITDSSGNSVVSDAAKLLVR